MKAIYLAPIALLALVGCSSAPKDTPAETPPKPAESAAMDSTTAPAATNVAMAKCNLCSAKVPSATLVDLHGQMACETCAASHSH